jgi:hypothetical protein
MLEGLDTVTWSAFAQPDWNIPDEVPRSLRALAASDSRQTADAAYHRLLYSVGNNHAGTYYPVIVPVLPFLGQILTEGNDWARLATLDVLIDLLISFEPEAGYEAGAASGEDEHALRRLVFSGAAQLATCMRPLADASGSQSVRQLASELLAIIARGPQLLRRS